MTKRVKENTQTILNFLTTLSYQYKKVASIDETLTALRSNVRAKQISEKDLKIAQASAADKLAKDKAMLVTLSTSLTDRKTQWEKRIEGLSVKIQKEDNSLQQLQKNADKIFGTVI